MVKLVFRYTEEDVDGDILDIVDLVTFSGNQTLNTAIVEIAFSVVSFIRRLRIPLFVVVFYQTEDYVILLTS